MYVRFLKYGWVGRGPIIVQDDKDDGVTGVLSGVVHARRLLRVRN